MSSWSFSEMRPTEKDQRGTQSWVLFLCNVLATPGRFNLVSLHFQYVRASIHLLSPPT